MGAGIMKDALEELNREHYDYDSFLRKFSLRGEAVRIDPDFRPVFTYVDALVKQGAFDHLKGLIYFTDGFGVFPRKKPEYETAFVFIDSGKNN